MGQSGSDDDDRKSALADLMAGRTQRGDVLGRQVLHLVDEDRHASADVCGEPTDIRQQLDQVDLDVSRVGSPGHCGHVDSGVPAITKPRGRGRLALGERLDDAENIVDVLALWVAELADRDMQGGTDGPSEPLVGTRFELASAPVCCLLYTSPSPRDRTRSRMP